MNKLNEVKKYLKGSNMYIGWSYSSDPAYYPVYETKSECMRARSEFFKKDCSKNYSKKQLEKMYEVRAFVFAVKNGLESNVPVCRVDEFKFF